MRNLYTEVGQKTAVFLATATALPSFAQTAPTSATQLAQAVDLSDAKSAALVVVSLLIGAGVVLWGARLVLSKFRPKL
jgi:hypothetical protein